MKGQPIFIKTESAEESPKNKIKTESIKYICDLKIKKKINMHTL